MQLLLCPALAAYLNLSPGLDFETRLFAKPMPPKCCAGNWPAPAVPQPIALGINTDAYQPIERRWRITRQLIEVMLETRHPFSLITKNALIERDLDLLARWRQWIWCTCIFRSPRWTTACLRSWSRVPRAACPAARDEGAGRCRRAGRV
jgi:hypothetical protein